MFANGDAQIKIWESEEAEPLGTGQETPADKPRRKDLDKLEAL